MNLTLLLRLLCHGMSRLWSHTDGSQQATASHFQSRSLLANNTDSSNSNYPTDLFSASERSNGAIVFHVIGVLYMFVALAIVCDDYFGMVWR